MQRDLFAGT